MGTFRKRVTSLFIAFAMVFGVAGVFNVVSATSASAATTSVSNAYGKWLPAGYGRPYGGHTGTMRSGYPNTGVGYCLDKNKARPSITGLYTDTTALGMTTERAAPIKYLINKYSRTTSNTVAYQVQLAIWREQDTYSMDRYMAQLVTWRYMTSTDVARVKAYNAEAAKRGPYRATMSLTPVYVGQNGSGTVTVLAANGTSAPAGIPVTLVSSSNARILSVNGVAGTKGVTRSDGKVVFTFNRTNIGTVSVTGTLTYASSTRVIIAKRLYSTQQRLGFNSLFDTAKVSASFEKKVGAPTLSNVCDTDCDGESTLTASICNPAGNKMLREEYFVNGVATSTRYVAAGTCDTASLRLHDADKVTSRYCYVATSGGACVTAYTVNPGTYEVVCPAWATAQIVIDCNCDGAWGKVNFTAPAGSTRFYTGRVVISNSGGVLSTKVVTLPAGQTVTVPIEWKLAAGVIIDAQFSVYKDSGLTQALVSNKTLAKVQVLETAGSGSMASVESAKVLTDTSAGSVTLGGTTLAK